MIIPTNSESYCNCNICENNHKMSFQPYCSALVLCLFYSGCLTCLPGFPSPEGPGSPLSPLGPGPETPSPATPLSGAQLVHASPWQHMTRGMDKQVRAPRANDEAGSMKPLAPGVLSYHWPR